MHGMQNDGRGAACSTAVLPPYSGAAGCFSQEGRWVAWKVMIFETLQKGSLIRGPLTLR